MEKKVVAAMAGVRFIYSAVQILSKLCLDRGADPFVLVFFRQAVATATIAPVALVSERNNFPSLSLLDYLKLFALAFCGNTFSVDLSFLGIRYTNATLSSATMNSVPVITFALAVILRKESIKGDYSTTLPKVMGVISCIGGVVTMALYKGPLLHSFNHHRLLVTHEGAHSHIQVNPSKHWIMGTFLLVLASMSWSLFIIFQRNFHKKCPSMLVFTTLLGLFSTTQTFVAALFFERDFSKWKLALAPIDFILYSVSGLGFFLQSWCIKKVGAVIYTMTIPLTLVITILFSSFVLGEATDLGSVLGGTLMIVGLYCVVLAKQKEEERREETTQEGNEARLQPIKDEEAV